jgi:hypothetical protein
MESTQMLVYPVRLPGQMFVWKRPIAPGMIAWSFAII